MYKRDNLEDYFPPPIQSRLLSIEKSTENKFYEGQVCKKHPVKE